MSDDGSGQASPSPSPAASAADYVGGADPSVANDVANDVWDAVEAVGHAAEAVGHAAQTTASGINEVITDGANSLDNVAPEAAE